MSELRIYSEDDPTQATVHTDGLEIAHALATIGVRFERWQAGLPLAADATQEEVLAAYRSQVNRIIAESGFVSVDVIGLTPDHPDKDAFRAKFLEEHTHGEFEIRFFVEGSGQFNIHKEGKVYSVVCTQDDLISVPANTPHWFDMGPAPHFRAIRFFSNPEGWVARFTGNEIASSFPRYE